MNRREFIFKTTLVGGLLAGSKLLALPKKPTHSKLTALYVLTDEPDVALELLQQYIPQFFSKNVDYHESEMVGNFVGDVVASNHSGIIDYKHISQFGNNSIATIAKKLNLPRSVSNPTLLTFLNSGLSTPESVSLFVDSKLTEIIPANSTERIRLVSTSGELYANISQGKVWVEGSSCKHKNCEHQGKIYRAGEQIICIPNHIRIELSGQNKYDAATY